MSSPAIDPRLRGAKSHGFALAVLLFLAGAVVYAPVLRAGFLHDDDELLTANPIVRRGGAGLGAESWAGLRELWLPSSGSFTRSHLPGIPVDRHRALDRVAPVGHQRSALRRRTSAGSARPAIHAVNVLLHVGCALLLWTVARAPRGTRRVGGRHCSGPCIRWASSRSRGSPSSRTRSRCCSCSRALHQWLRWTDEHSRAARGGARLLAFLLALLVEARGRAVPARADDVDRLVAAGARSRPSCAPRRRSLRARARGGRVRALQRSRRSRSARSRSRAGGPFERVYRRPRSRSASTSGRRSCPSISSSSTPAGTRRCRGTCSSAPGVLAAALLGASWRARARCGPVRDRRLRWLRGDAGPVLGLVPMSYMRHTLVAGSLPVPGVAVPRRLDRRIAVATLDRRWAHARAVA
jgi:hypothetical protein